MKNDNLSANKRYVFQGRFKVIGKNRDEFTSNDKRIMAERVSWKCSFPGCGRNTVDPNSAL